jgi:hypothetical protein
MRFAYEIQPGESIACLGDGRVIVAHPDRPPVQLEFDDQGRRILTELQPVNPPLQIQSHGP